MFPRLSASSRSIPVISTAKDQAHSVFGKDLNLLSTKHPTSYT